MGESWKRGGKEARKRRNRGGREARKGRERIGRGEEKVVL